MLPPFDKNELLKSSLQFKVMYNSYLKKKI